MITRKDKCGDQCLREGARVAITIIQEKQIGPTLGKEGVKKGVYASIIALIAITLAN